jgi:hypothetical protein
MKKLLLLVVFLFIAFEKISYSQNGQLSLSALKNDIKQQKEIKVNDFSVNLYHSSDEKKKVGLAIFYSLLLPGMGELYADGYSSGVYFTIADGVLWSSLLGMNIYGNWQENRYKSFAEVYAGVNPSGKDKDFYANIGAYLSIDDYNTEKALERDFKAMLDKDKYFWQWNSVEQRRTYRAMWLSSEETFNNIRFVVGGLILNRILSIINAVRLTSKYNKKFQQDEVSLDFYLSRDAVEGNKFNLSFRKNF